MSFVSIPFAILLPTLLILLWLLRSPVAKKLILLIASCIFYAYWDWRFLGLLALVTVLDYYISNFLAVSTTPRLRQMLLLSSVVTNLGFLAFFKYFNFFLDNINLVLRPLGWQLGTLVIILPIGISFYIFETLSYVIDVYRGRTRPVRSLLDYAIFITFFPRLVAGPIMRATEFLPQLARGIEVNWPNISAGAQLLLRGLLKKVVVADNMALLVNTVYDSPSLFTSGTTWLAVFAYSVQIFFDFSGYTDMAVGIARMMGFQLPPNFQMPYTAESLTEFWQRWHISLSSWLRDYLYIPLGGNRKGTVRTYINLMLTMLLGGLWHGASWNFVLWGGLHGSYLALERQAFGKPATPGRWNAPLTWARALGVFLLVTVTWIPFRSPSLETTWTILQKLMFLTPTGLVWMYTPALIAIPAVIIGGFLIRWLDYDFTLPPLYRSFTFASMAIQVLIIYFFAPLNISPFIYFQF